MKRPPIVALAIAEAGGVNSLARFLGLRSQAVSMWTRVPAHHVLKVEQATESRVTRYQMRPDLYPPPQRSAA